MLKALFLLNGQSYDLIYGEKERQEIAKLVDVCTTPQTKEYIEKNPAVLRDVEVIFSGWGVPIMDEQFLNAAKKLKMVFHGAGSIKGFVTEALWNRGIRVTSAYAANAIPVAEFTLSQILFCLKLGWQFYLSTKKKKKWTQEGFQVFGAYGSTVGLISFGVISQKVIELLKPFDVNILLNSSHVTKEKAANLNVELCSLEDIFKKADVISLHSPFSNKTEGMITGEHIASMKPNAGFINTARGGVVRENEMIESLKKRQDLIAVLDVTWPEPPSPDSELYTTPNIVLTPHIAGSAGPECKRMGRYMVNELKRYLAGESLQWEITQEKAAYLA